MRRPKPLNLEKRIRKEEKIAEKENKENQNQDLVDKIPNLDRSFLSKSFRKLTNYL